MDEQHGTQPLPMRTTRLAQGRDRFPQSAVERTIGERFFEIADRFADRDAISSPSARWTYGQFAQEIRRIAGGIASALGPDHGETVAILCDHDGPLVATLMAVICSGNVAIILDPTTSSAQNAAVLEEAQPTLVLADATHLITASHLAEQAGCECHELSTLTGNFRRPNSLTSRSPAMMAFTSGTSHSPKGAVISHSVILNGIRGGIDSLGLHPDDRLPLLFPLSLTLAAFPVFGALLCGACVAVLDVRAVGIAPISEFFRTEHITVAFLAPTVARFMLDGIGGQPFPSIRMVMLAGEPVDSEILATTCAAFGCDEMAVAYGTTETGLLTIAVYPHDSLPEGEVSCGYPVPDVDLVVVDNQGHPAEPGRSGEIVVVSDHLFDGYVGHPELGRLVLGKDPSGRTSRSAYRTGDLGRFSEHGSLWLDGRSGLSVKIRGRLVNVGDVESDIRDLEGVLDATVIATSLHGVMELIAYVVPKDSAEAEPTRWRASLLASHEQYRVPTRWVTVDEFPLLPNGKVNRRALPSASSPTRALGGTAMSPSERGTLHQLVHDLWEELLPVGTISDDEDFFELGGDSLLAAQMLVILEHRTGIVVPMGELLHARTVREVTSVLNRLSKRTEGATSGAACVQQGDESVLPRLWFVHDLQGSAFRVRHIAAALGADQPVWSFESPLLAGHRNTFTSLESFAANYVSTMIEEQPQGPYWLAGYSFGGICVYEMARQMSDAGQEVAFLGIIDIGPGFRGRGWNSRRSPLRPWFGIAPPPMEGANLRDSLRHYRSMAAESPVRCARHLMVRSGMSRVVDPIRFELDLRRRGVVRPEWRLWYAWEQHWKLAARSWSQRGGYSGCIDLFWAAETASSDATMGWGSLAADLRVHRFHGDHFGVLEERGAGSLAPALRSVISKTLASNDEMSAH